MKKTVIEIRAMLEGLPDNMLVEFSPITSAYLGGNPLRVSDMHIYKDLKWALPSTKGAYATIHIVEDIGISHEY